MNWKTNTTIAVLALMLGMLSSSCKRNEALTVHRSILESPSVVVGSAAAEASKFGLGPLTRRQHSMLYNRVLQNMREDRPLVPGEHYSNTRIEIESTTFFIFRNSRARAVSDVRAAPEQD